ncbi:hypothetical protein [Microbacterium oxydans]|uniref:hypothetical protein n=1 Tax=Microbacterium oxydans TaxID=82380 RepID=UPI00226B18C5|nr:hypothetical protein [Microbacterium oxydans]WAA66993.1 hypothetical protein MME74_04390 [Microbacterium oxydans]
MDGRDLTDEGAPDDLAAAIEAAVRATPGVRNVYRSGSLISHLLRVGAAAIGVRADDAPIVSVVRAEDGAAVEVSIGVDADARSAEVLSAVRAAIDGLFAARGLRRTGLTLTVVHVPSREAA